MSGTKISKLVLGVVLLLVLGTLVIVTTSSGDLVGLAAEVVATPAPSPTPTLSLAWQNAALDQIHFGEPKVVLTDTMGLRIVGWISNEEILILRDIKMGGRGSAIEVVNVKSGKVGRLAEGNIWGKPIWSPQAKAIAYLMYDEGARTEELIWQPIGGEARSLRSGVVQPIVLAPGGRGAMAYSVKERKLAGKFGERQMMLPFAPFGPPGPLSICGWKYDTAVSPDEKWQVVYNCEHFLLVNSEKGTIKEIDLGDWVTDGALPRWALKAQWSPDGQMIAVVATVDGLPNQIRFLLLVDPYTGNLREISVSRPFVIYEVQWSPIGRFLLLSGATRYTEMGYAIVEHRLIDISTGEQRKITLLPSNTLGGASFAWSPDGKRIILNCTTPGQAALCDLGVEVGQ